MIRSGKILLLLAFLACILSCAYAAPPKAVTVVPGFDLSIGDMQISDPEHTAEYLEKTGGPVRQNLDGNKRNLAGNWSLELTDLGSRPMGNIELQLFQSGSVIFGKGVFKQGLKNQLAAAEGSLSGGESLNLNVVTLADVFLYRLDLDSDGNSTSGTFTLFAPAGGSIREGTVFGGRSDIRRIS